MRIAIIGNETLPLHDATYRATERFTRALAQEMVSRGHGVTLYSQGTDLGCECIPLLGEEENERLCRLSKDESKNQDQIAQLKREIYLKVLKDIASKDFDIIHNNSFHPSVLLASDKLKAIMVTTLHSGPTAEQRYVFSKMGRDIHSYFCANSHHIKKEWVKNLGTRDIAVIAQGIMDTSVEPPARRLKNMENAVFWSGSITPGNGLHQALQACHLAGVPLMFAGKIQDYDYYNQAIRPLMGNNDKYLGNLERSDTQAAIQSARAGILTPMEPRQWRPSPLEMLARGLPLVSYNLDPVREFVNSRNGYLAKPSNILDLADGIAYTKNLNRAAIKKHTFAKYNFAATTLRYEKIYKFLKVLHEKDRKEQAYWDLHTPSGQGTLA